MEVVPNWYYMAHGDAWKQKWRGNGRMEWVSSKPHKTIEHSLPSTLQMLPADLHACLAASSRLNFAPTESHGLICFAERWNLVSARVPSNSNCSIHWILYGDRSLYITHTSTVCIPTVINKEIRRNFDIISNKLDVLQNLLLSKKFFPS
jgi:hypothetical protein